MLVVFFCRPSRSISVDPPLLSLEGTNVSTVPIRRGPLVQGTQILSAFVAVSLGSVARAQENVYIEAFSSLLVYLPDKGSWWPNSNPQPGPNGTSVMDYYHAGECQSSLVLGASVSFTFSGSYIAYYGDMHQSHGEMEVNLDGKVTRLTTYTPLPYGTPQVKFFEAQVDPDVVHHTIKLTNLEDNKYTSLDYFLYTPLPPIISELPASAPESTVAARPNTGTLVSSDSSHTTAHTVAPINLNDRNSTISTYSPLPYGTPQVKLFEAQVDPRAVRHTIKLTNLEAKTIGLDYFVVVLEKSPVAFPGKGLLSSVRFAHPYQTPSPTRRAEELNDALSVLPSYAESHYA
ncbi:hypothetical protein AURDEDRAFT_160000 [Auricularia subglabra TFB-10046 SS5]|nr:hypothetical protein AURDEDRAFT_160000 [Auricularia subglabra TFB-10046 SS5]